MEPASGIGMFFGFKISNLIAGGLGGMVRFLIVGGGYLPAFTSVFIGTVTSGYLTPTITLSKINYLDFPEGTIGYLVGVTAMYICEGALMAVRRWSRSASLPGEQA